MDRSFLERVWKWLIQNPAIRLGNHAGHKRLTLSEVEARNATIKQAKKSDTALRQETDSATPILSKQGKGRVHTQDATSVPRLTSKKKAPKFPIHSGAESRYLKAENQTGPPEKSSSAITGGPNGQHRNSIQPASHNDELNNTADMSSSISTIRLYASEHHMWHALAGHGPDPNKIKALDFACLSMIAIHGRRGVYQHELVKISGQDKRSLPARTDRLHNDAYIEKKRVCVQQYHPKRLLNTSHLVLKRFAEGAPNVSRQQDAEVASSNEDTVEADYNNRVHDGKAKAQSIVPDEQDRLADRPIPHWTPDRSLSNQIFDLVARSGTQGMTMKVGSLSTL